MFPLVYLSLRRLEVHLVVRLPLSRPLLRDWHLELRSVRRLHGQQGVAGKRPAHVVVSHVRQMLVRDVVGDVLDALLHPLERER